MMFNVQKNDKSRAWMIARLYLCVNCLKKWKMGVHIWVGFCPLRKGDAAKKPMNLSTPEWASNSLYGFWIAGFSLQFAA